MALIVQMPEGGALERRLRAEPAVGQAEVTLAPVRPVSPGLIDPPQAGRAVFTTASPEGLVRERDELLRAVETAGAGSAPLTVVVEGAEELREDELRAALDAAARAKRDLILVLRRDIER
jgi:hypothetical protein